jgi:uncharacterized protein
MYQDSVDTKVLYDIISSLVSCPGDIHIDRKEDEMGILLSVRVNPVDMGILIGRNGIMATSIKVVMKAIGKSNDMQLRVQFLEPEGSTHVRNSEGNSVPGSTGAPQPSVDHELDEFIIN